MFSLVFQIFSLSRFFRSQFHVYITNEIFIYHRAYSSLHFPVPVRFFFFFIFLFYSSFTASGICNQQPEIILATWPILICVDACRKRIADEGKKISSLHCKSAIAPNVEEQRNLCIGFMQYPCMASDYGSTPASCVHTCEITSCRSISRHSAKTITGIEKY